MTQPTITIRDEHGRTLEPKANGGAYEGASRRGQELASWRPPILSADAEITREKLDMDARNRDMTRNDGYVMGALNIRRDSIVGDQYVLNAQPDYEALGADETWAEEYQRVVESKFDLWWDSDECWPDACRMSNGTSLVRLAIAQHFMHGEVLATAEWLRSAAQRRPYSTAIQMVDPDRLSNPQGLADTRYLRGGVELDNYGAPIAYHIRLAHPYEKFLDATAPSFEWKRVLTRKNWGRLQVIHIFERDRAAQTRGVSHMVSVLKQMRMTKKFQEIVLQSAVVNATYAAAIESELPPEVIQEALGAGSPEDNGLTRYLDQIAGYTGGSKALQIDGVKIPHLFPGTKLNFKQPQAPGNSYAAYEQSLLRHIASALGLSYEQFSRDYTNTNYSSARASMVETWKAMQSIKKMIADRFATAVFALWLEEAINKGEIPLPGGAGPEFFYEGLNREALTKCVWIGASRGQIDELKETQAAELRVKAGFSTLEAEIARIGGDWRRVLRQQAREKKMREDLGLIPTAEELAAQEAGAAGSQNNNEDTE
jgi:lambda family phage portal protein